MLHALASGLAAGAWDVEETASARRLFEGRLLAAARADGGLATDTPGWWSYRGRRLERALLAGDLPLPGRITAELAAGNAELRVGRRVLYSPPGRG